MQIVGEPGLGKSRLVEEFRVRLGVTPHTWAQWSSSQLLQNTPLHPIAEWGRQRFTGEARLSELEAALASVKLDPAEHAPLLAPLLDIPVPEERAPKLAAEELRRMQLAAAVAWVLAGARSQPLVLAFEDLHWADPTTLDLMKALAERGGQAPLLIVATTRPEFRAPWSTRSHHSVLSLSPLDRAQIGQMVGAIAERHALSKDVVEGLSDRTAGVPLFIEELTRLVLEGGAETIPPTLQQSLAARLDRLGEAREVAQIGAVLGREFSHALLAAVADLPAPTLNAALEKLAEADLLLVEGTAPASTYRFKHALIQDAAYDSLLKSRRHALHQRAAETLRRSAETPPEVLAHHYTQAGLDDLAIEYWGKAGDAALRRSAFQEAIAHLGKAIEMADRAESEKDTSAPAKAPPAANRAKLQASLGQALIWTKGHQARETTAAFARAVELEDGTESSADRCAAYYGVYAGAITRGEPEKVREMAERFAQEIAARPGSPEAMVGHRVLGVTHFYAGDFATAAQQLRQALQLYDRERHRDLANRVGQDPGPQARIYLAKSLWVMGRIDEALSHADLAWTEAQSNGHPPTTVFVLINKLMLSLLRDAQDPAAADYQTLVDLLAQHELAAYWTADAIYFRGWVRWRRGEREAALADMREGIQMLRDLRFVLYLAYFEPILAEAEGADAALTRIDDALAEIERTGHRYYEAETHRLRGELLLKRDPADVALAEQAFLTAIAVAQKQGARSFELRAALELAKLYQSIGRSADARAALAPALEGFPPTEAFPEITEAQELLGALAGDESVKSALAERGARAKLHVDYARALQWGKGFAAEETRAAFERAGEVVAAASDAAAQWSTVYGRFAVHYVRAEYVEALEIAELYLSQAQAAGQPSHVLNGRRLRGSIRFLRGEFEAGIDDLQAVAAGWSEERDAALRHLTGADVLCVAQSFLAAAFVLTGRIAATVVAAEGAIRRAESLDDVGALAFALHNAAMDYCYCERWEDAAARAERLVDLAAERHMAFWELSARAVASAARGHLRDTPANIVELKECLRVKRERGDWQVYASWLGWLASLQMAVGANDEALASLTEAFAVVARTGERMVEAELHRLRGDALATMGAVAAEASYREALDIARAQGARTFELKAALALARLLQTNYRPLDAHDALAPALEGIEARPEFSAIAEAQALLAALAGVNSATPPSGA